MRKCEYCGHENGDEATSCAGCHTEFLVPTAMLRRYERPEVGPLGIHPVLEQHPILLRLLGVLSAVLGTGLCLMALPALLLAYMCFSGNGPGGSSGASAESVLDGIVFLLMAFASVAAGFLCVRWAFDAWESPRRVDRKKPA